MTGPKGDTGATGLKGDTGATGPAGLGTITITNPTRTLNTTFQPSATKATLVTYTIAMSATNPLLVGNSAGQVQLLSDANATPTTVRGTLAIGSAVGVTVTVALTTSNTMTLSYIVPAGHNVRLASSTTGSATITLLTSTEQTLG